MCNTNKLLTPSFKCANELTTNLFVAEVFIKSFLVNIVKHELADKHNAYANTATEMTEDALGWNFMFELYSL